MMNSPEPPQYPSTPSTAYLDSMQADIDAGIAAATVGQPADREQEAYEGQRRLWEVVTGVGESLTDTLTHIVKDLHAHPEVAFKEVRSMNELANIVEDAGHPVTRGVYGVDTAFEAVWASDGFDPHRHPTISIMAEYDALPGLGHACGHNVIAAAGVGAFLAASEVLKGSGLQGRVLLQGTPAEEGHTGKEYMIRGGALEGVDAAVMVHGFGYDVGSHAWVGRRSVSVTFKGVAAHASSQPFMGRNALDAATLAYQAMGLLRQQMPPSDRLHAIITEGGDRPSIVPPEAKMDIYVRSLGNRTLMDLSERIDDIIAGAAQMTGCGVEARWDPHPMSLPVRNSATLVERWTATQAARGRVALPAGTVPETLAASTDFGNVSNLVPGLHPMVKVSPPEVALHTEAFAHWAQTDDAVKAAVDSAIGLAQVAVDLLADGAFLEAAKQEFEATGGAVSVTELLAQP